MPSIEFLSQKSSFKLNNPRKISAWIKAVCAKEGCNVGNLTYVFCSDAYLKSMNHDFLKHSTYTDIISFDLADGSEVEGEIYISVDRVRDNAKKFSQEFETELRRVMIHGVLHFLGYKDKTTSQKAQMRSKEEACLSLWS